MPRLNLYVSDDDKRVIDAARKRAESIGYSLSALVVELLAWEPDAGCPHVTCHVCEDRRTK